MAKITSEMQPLSQILVRSSDQFIIPDFNGPLFGQMKRLIISSMILWLIQTTLL